MDGPEGLLETPLTPEQSDKSPTPDTFLEESAPLRMSREAMLELARRDAGTVECRDDFYHGLLCRVHVLQDIVARVGAPSGPEVKWGTITDGSRPAFS